MNTMKWRKQSADIAPFLAILQMVVQPRNTPSKNNDDINHSLTTILRRPPFARVVFLIHSPQKKTKPLRTSPMSLAIHRPFNFVITNQIHFKTHTIISNYMSICIGVNAWNRASIRPPYHHMWIDPNNNTWLSVFRIFPLLLHSTDCTGCGSKPRCTILISCYK